MFDILEKNFELINANLLKQDIDLSNSEIYEKFKSYIAYCYSQVDSLIKDVNKLAEDKNRTISSSQFEQVYEERVLYRIDDITEEMFILQSFLGMLHQKYPEQTKVLMDAIDDVEAGLMLLPEEIEKVKCIMLALLK